jgi:hypothetical protein
MLKRKDRVDSLSPLVTIPVQSFTRSSLASMVNDSVTFNLTVSPSAPNEH